MEFYVYADGNVLATVSSEAAAYSVGEPMIFWYIQDTTSGAIGFDIESNTNAASTVTFTSTGKRYNSTNGE